MKKILAYIITISLACISFAQQIKGGGFSPSTIRPNETAQYTIILEGLSGSVNPSAIPMPDGLQIVGTSSSRNVSITNGKMSTQTELIFTVLASKEGKFTVPEWKLENFKIEPATLVVDKNAPLQQRRQNAMSILDDDDMFGFPSAFQRIRNMQRTQMQQAQQMQQQQKSLGALKDYVSLKIQMPKEKIFVGEAIQCKLVFSYKKELVAEGIKLAKLMPMPNKSDAFDCTLLEDKYSANTNDEHQITISYDIIITPLKAGSYNLDFNAQGVFLQEYKMDSYLCPKKISQQAFRVLSVSSQFQM